MLESNLRTCPSQPEGGARGEKGATGPRGSAGKPAREQPTITAYKVDTENYKLTPLLSNGQFGCPVSLYPLFEKFLRDISAAQPWRTD
jgi:hypothetical protein